MKSIMGLVLVCVFTMLVGCRVSGTVTSNDGEPMEGVGVRLVGQGGDGAINETTSTNTSGKYEFKVTLDDRDTIDIYSLCAYDPQYIFSPSQYKINDASGDLDSMDFVRVPGWASGDGRGASIVQRPDGGYLIVGSSGNITKTDAGGTVQEQRELKPGERLIAECIRETFDGGYIILARIMNDSWYSPRSLWLIKLDENGDTLWDKRVDFGVWGIIRANFIQQTADGGYIISGSNQKQKNVTPPVMSYDPKYGLLIKTTGNGTVSWSKTYIVEGEDASYGGISETPDGKYIGVRYVDLYVNPHIYTIFRADENGNEYWTKSLTADEKVADIHSTADNGYVYCSKISDDATDVTVAKLTLCDADGNEIWSNIYSDKNYIRPAFVRHATDGGFYIGGIASTDNYNDESISKANEYIWISKVDNAGEKEWIKFIYNDQIYSSALSDGFATADQGFITVGYLGGCTDKNWLMKMDELGNFQ